MFDRLGRLMVRRARLVLALGLIVLAASVALGAGAFGRLLSQGFDDPASDSSQASVLLDQQFGGEPDLLFLVHAKSGTVDDTAVAAAGFQLSHRLAADSRLSGVISYFTTKSGALRSQDGSDALILTRVAGADSTAAALIRDYGSDSAVMEVQVGGALGTDIGGQVGKDLAVAESIAVPITVALLVLAFGSLVSALLPLSVSVVAIFGTFAELFLITQFTDVSIFAINLTTALGLGLGIDYALLMVSRFREQLASGNEVGEAVARTVATAGRTIAFSALAVSAALAAMLVFPVYFLKSFAYAGVGVTVLSALAALTVLPALLAVLGNRVNAGRIPGVNALRSAEAPFWGRLARIVLRRPVLAATPVVLILLLLATPLRGVTFGSPDDRVLPTSAQSHQVGDAVRTKFATAPSGIDVVLSPPATSAAQLRDYARSLSALPDVQRVDTSAGSFRHSTATAPGMDPARMAAAGTQRISISTAVDSRSAAAQRLVSRVRATPVPAGGRALVGGSSAILVDAKHAISDRLPLAGLIILGTTFLLLFLFTGSIVAPIRALLGNILTLGATLGVVVWIFQDGHFSGLLGFTPTPTDTSMPVLLFCIAFGLSMDYEVFVMSRIKELHDAGMSNQDAVVHGLARTGRIVSTAAALLAVSFFAFVTGSVSFIQFFGLGTGLAILIDATLVRGVLVPAFMGIAGEASWYAPAPLRRLHQRIGLSDADATADTRQTPARLTPLGQYGGAVLERTMSWTSNGSGEVTGSPDSSARTITPAARPRSRSG